MAKPRKMSEILNGGETIENSNASKTGLAIQGASAQTGNLVEVKNNEGDVLNGFDKDGNLINPPEVEHPKSHQGMAFLNVATTGSANPKNPMGGDAFNNLSTCINWIKENISINFCGIMMAAGTYTENSTIDFHNTPANMVIMASGSVTINTNTPGFYMLIYGGNKVTFQNLTINCTNSKAKGVIETFGCSEIAYIGCNFRSVSNDNNYSGVIRAGAGVGRVLLESCNLEVISGPGKCLKSIAKLTEFDKTNTFTSSTSFEGVLASIEDGAFSLRVAPLVVDTPGTNKVIRLKNALSFNDDTSYTLNNGAIIEHENVKNLPYNFVNNEGDTLANITQTGNIQMRGKTVATNHYIVSLNVATTGSTTPVDPLGSDPFAGGDPFDNLTSCFQWVQENISASILIVNVASGTYNDNGMVIIPSYITNCTITGASKTGTVINATTPAAYINSRGNALTLSNLTINNTSTGSYATVDSFVSRVFLQDCIIKGYANAGHTYDGVVRIRQSAEIELYTTVDIELLGGTGFALSCDGAHFHINKKDGTTNTVTLKSSAPSGIALRVADTDCKVLGRFSTTGTAKKLRFERCTYPMKTYDLLNGAIWEDDYTLKNDVTIEGNLTINNGTIIGGEFPTNHYNMVALNVATTGSANPEDPLGGDAFDIPTRALAWAVTNFSCNMLMLNIAPGTYTDDGFLIIPSYLSGVNIQGGTAANTIINTTQFNYLIPSCPTFNVSNLTINQTKPDGYTVISSTTSAINLKNCTIKGFAKMADDSHAVIQATKQASVGTNGNVTIECLGGNGYCVYMDSGTFDVDKGGAQGTGKLTLISSTSTDEAVVKLNGSSLRSRDNNPGTFDTPGTNKKIQIINGSLDERFVRFGLSNDAEFDFRNYNKGNPTNHYNMVALNVATTGSANPENPLGGDAFDKLSSCFKWVENNITATALQVIVADGTYTDDGGFSIPAQISLCGIIGTSPDTTIINVTYEYQQYIYSYCTDLQILNIAINNLNTNAQNILITNKTNVYVSNVKFSGYSKTQKYGIVQTTLGGSFTAQRDATIECLGGEGYCLFANNSTISVDDGEKFVLNSSVSNHGIVAKFRDCNITNSFGVPGTFDTPGTNKKIVLMNCSTDEKFEFFGLSNGAEFDFQNYSMKRQFKSTVPELVYEKQYADGEPSKLDAEYDFYLEVGYDYEILTHSMETNIYTDKYQNVRGGILLGTAEKFWLGKDDIEPTSEPHSAATTININESIYYRMLHSGFFGGDSTASAIYAKYFNFMFLTNRTSCSSRITLSLSSTDASKTVINGMTTGYRGMNKYTVENFGGVFMGKNVDTSPIFGPGKPITRLKFYYDAVTNGGSEALNPTDVTMKSGLIQVYRLPRLNPPVI